MLGLCNLWWHIFIGCPIPGEICLAHALASAGLATRALLHEKFSQTELCCAFPFSMNNRELPKKEILFKPVSGIWDVLTLPDYAKRYDSCKQNSIDSKFATVASWVKPVSPLILHNFHVQVRDNFVGRAHNLNLVHLSLQPLARRVLPKDYKKTDSDEVDPGLLLKFNGECTDPWKQNIPLKKSFVLDHTIKLWYIRDPLEESPLSMRWSSFNLLNRACCGCLALTINTSHM